MAKINKADVITVDFETKPIGDRPYRYPPEPVGVAVLGAGIKQYYAWGHPTENNCTKQDAARVLKSVWNKPLVFHNGPFDIEVAMKHVGVAWPRDWHDTLFLAYLHDPRERTLALKPLAEKYLNLPPNEQDLLRDWILNNIPEAKKKPSSWGEYIHMAPGKLVGKYAMGDVKRTADLFALLHDRVVNKMGMGAPYDRELALAPIVVRMEQRGIPIATNRLKKDLLQWENEYEDLANKIRRKLKAGPDLNIGSSKQLADALDAAGKVDAWEKTATGGRSTKRDNLMKHCNDKDLLNLLARHSILDTYITTFGEPWLISAEQNGGLLYPSFNQVRSTDEYGGGGVGTKTGRFSSSNPNFQNVPRNPEDPDKPYTLGLPKMRDYIVPPKGGVLFGRDYSQQELRILAHFEDGVLLNQYLKNPKLDVHDFVGELIFNSTGVKYPRSKIKVTNFGLIYGMGVDKLAAGTKSTYDEAAALKKSVLNSLPGIKDVNKELKRMARNDEPLRTWGGRLYWVEEPREINGHLRTFEYKMLNLLIQGSAADCTKEAMIRVDEAFGDDAAMRLQVHDELLCSCDKGTEKKNMKLLKDAMEGVEFDVPMLSDGKLSKISWAQMTKYKD